MPPSVKITYPYHAGRAKGPDVTVTWSAENVGLQQISIDGHEYIDVPADRRSHTISNLREGVHTVRVLVNQTREASATFYVYIPVQLHACKLYTLDLRRLRRPNPDDPIQTTESFDTLHCVACLQGIVNRQQPQLYIYYGDADLFWLDKMRAKGAYLEHVELTPLESIEEAIFTFADSIKGAVVWDPNVPSTSNVASTICGVDDLVPVRHDPTPGSLYDRLIINGPKIKIVKDLVGKFNGTGTIPDSNRPSTGSAKCDSYLWAKMHYIDTGKCNPGLIGYWCDAFWLKSPKDMGIDNVGLPNHDFAVARRGFICDLHCWGDEAPRDDPDQRVGLDLETLEEILAACAKANKGRMIHFAGFTPWAMKYTDHANAGGKHGGVPTEWEMVRVTTSYNCFTDADAIGPVDMANASVFQHYPLPDRLVQNRPPTRTELEKKGYIESNGKVAPLNFVYYYLGDYDSAAWMYNRLPGIWTNPVRGKIPSGWAFNPNLIERAPMIFDYCYETRTPLDFFVAGDSGAGYVNPTNLLHPRKPSGLPSADAAWIEHNIRYFNRLNYSITGFLINGFCGELTDEANRMYAHFSADGVMTQMWMPRDKKQDHLLDGMPVAHMKQDLGMTPEISAKEIIKHGRPGETAFLAFRTILESPDWIKTVNELIRRLRPDCRFEPVDPYTYFYLLRHHLGGRNEMRATYTFDTMPAEVKAGKTVALRAGVRNDGWETWSKSGNDAVVLTARFGDRGESVATPISHDVKPGEGTVIEMKLTAPPTRGEYRFTLELRRGADRWFGDAGDLPWSKQVRVL